MAVSNRLSAFLALSLTIHAGLLVFAMHGDSRPPSRTTEILAIRLIEAPPAVSPAPNRPSSHPRERITPPKLLAQPKPLPEARQVEVGPTPLGQDLPIPIEPPIPAPVPVASSSALPKDEIRPGPLSPVAGQPDSPGEPGSGTRFAVATPTTGGGSLTFPAAVGGVTSPTGVGGGSGLGGSRQNGSTSGISIAQPRGGYQVLPRYPESARRQGIQGTTELKVHILSDGSIAEALVARSAGYPELDESALEAVKRWRFEPARRGHEPVAVWALIPVRFRIE